MEIEATSEDYLHELRHLGLEFICRRSNDKQKVLISWLDKVITINPKWHDENNFEFDYEGKIWVIRCVDDFSFEVIKTREKFE